MTAIVPLYTPNTSLDTADLRALIAAAFDTRPFVLGTSGVPTIDNGGTGVVGDGLKVTGGGSSVTIAKGLAVVKGTNDTGSHAYIAGLSADEAINSIPAATTARKDIIYLGVLDEDEGGDVGDGSCYIDIAAGTDSGSPTDPTLPDHSSALARLNLTSGGIITIDDLRTRAVAAGGTLIVPTEDDLPDEVWIGRTVFVISTMRMVRHNGTAWVDELALSTAGVRTWTPAVAQSGAVTATVTGRYLRQGCLVTGWAKIAITGSGSAGTGVEITLPVAPSGHASADALGPVTIYDSSATTRYTGMVEFASGSSVVLVTDATAGSTWGQVPSIGLANGDAIRLQVQYTV